MKSRKAIFISIYIDCISLVNDVIEVARAKGNKEGSYKAKS